MQTSVDKTPQTKEQSSFSDSSEKQSGGIATSHFSDNRTEAMQLKRNQQIANESNQSKQTAQLQEIATNHADQQPQPIQKKENNTGLPDNLKSGIENLSGHSMNDVKVHYNSQMPAQLQAHAYAQGTDIHVASGQEKHLPHEAWHVVQQKEGRVKPTTTVGGTQVNDNPGLENEATTLGNQAAQMISKEEEEIQMKSVSAISDGVAQLATSVTYKTQEITSDADSDALEVGRETVADLDVSDPLNGSTPATSADHDVLMHDLNETYEDAGFLRGHLLNDNLGGLGVWPNMFPITKNANTHHLESAERKVKQAVLDATENDEKFDDKAEIESVLSEEGDADFESGTYFYEADSDDEENVWGERNEVEIPDEWKPEHIVEYTINVDADSPDNFLADPSANIDCEWEIRNESDKPIEVLSPQGDFLKGDERIRSQAGVKTGQNAKLEALGWGSDGKGRRSGANIIVEGVEMDIPDLAGYRGVPLTNAGKTYAYKVTVEPDEDDDGA